MINPFLIGKKIYLRGLEESDIEGNYFQWFNDSEITKFNSHGNFPNNKKKMLDYVQHIHTSRNDLVLGIFDIENDFHIGNISLQSIDWFYHSAEYAIIVGEKSYWGKGIAREASDLLIDHGFIQLNLNRIHCGTSEDNTGMQKLALYMGMTQEGVLRQAMYKNGSFKNIYLYSILKEEYLKNRS